MNRTMNHKSAVLLLVITGLLIFIYTRFAKLEDMEVV